jgi:hypothetical protein
MMKRAGRLVVLMALLSLAGAWSRPARAEVGFDFFYSNLSPHGSWLVSAQYGRVWQPSVYADDWNPYYDGRWVYSDLGWTWVSDYEWGAIPYHYGTWVIDPAIGWVWVPGYVWAPSWVVFRTGPDYIGWAPVSPGFTVGVSVGFGARVSGPFVFVAARDFVSPRLRTCIIPRGETRVVLNRTTVVNTLVVEKNVVVNRGPDVRIVERASGRSIREVPIERVSRVAPGRGFTREQIAVEPRGARRGLRVAEPVAQSAPRPERDGRAVRDARTPRDVRSPRETRPPREAWTPRAERPPRAEFRPDRPEDRSPRRPPQDERAPRPRARPRDDGPAPGAGDQGGPRDPRRPKQHGRPPRPDHP